MGFSLWVDFDRARFLWQHGYTTFVNVLAENMSPGIETLVVWFAYQVLNKVEKNETDRTMSKIGLERVLVVSLYTVLAFQLCFGAISGSFGMWEDI
jgi:hypothetical protein